MGTSKALNDVQKTARKQSILNAAGSLLNKNRVEFPSVSDIAKQAGVGKGTVYLYFDSKETLFLHLFEQLFSGCVSQFDQLNNQFNLEQLSNFWFENPTFGRLLIMTDAVLLPNLPMAQKLEYRQRRDTVLYNKVQQLGLSQQDNQIAHWQSLLLLIINVIQLVWTEESMYDEKEPNKKEFIAKVRSIVSPICDTQMKLIGQAKKSKRWRSFLKKINGI